MNDREVAVCKTDAEDFLNEDDVVDGKLRM